MAVAKKYKVDFEPLNTVERKILAEIPETILDKLQTIKDLESIAMLSKNSLTEEERIMLVARRKAFDDIIYSIKSLKQEKEKADEETLRKQKASKIVV